MATTWPTIDPQEAGFAPGFAEHVEAARQAGKLPGLHGLVVARHGRLVLEWYGAGEDYAWNRSLGPVVFGRDTLHDLRSVTKSVTGVLYGIALASGEAPSPSEPLLTHFPEYPDLLADPDRARLTVEHALTMTLGLDWNESAPYTSAENSEIAMEFANDRYRYILARPIAEAPGTRWRYCGGASALLGALIARGTGTPIDAFARDHLFKPLGIESFEWMRGADGVAAPASGLRLAPHDLARIGQLLLDRGTWENRQIVPASWLDEMLRPRIRIDSTREYGYQWYLGSSPSAADEGQPRRWYGANGNGGQRLFVLPELDLVVAMTAGNYDNGNGSAVPKTLFEELILPAVRPS